MIKKRAALLLAALLFVMTALTGCGSKTEDKQSNDGTNGEKQEPMVLNWNIGSDPKTIDPGINSAIDGTAIINNTFEGLMREVSGELVNAGAEKVDISEDGLVYTFHLRDAKWSDGQPVTASDYEYAWKRVIDPNTGSEQVQHMFYIKGAKDYYTGNGKIEDVGIKKVDEKTFEVTLESPAPFFLQLISRYTFFPVRQDMVEKEPDGWAKNPETAISNGPFCLAEYNLGEKIVLKKNPYYWNADNVKLDQINAFMLVEQSTMLTAYESGEMDIIDDMPVQEIPRLMKEDPTFVVKQEIGPYYLIFNVNKEPVNDPKVRRALALAIDRKGITEHITRAGEIPATGFVAKGLKDSEGNEFYDKAGNYGIDPNGPKIEEAKQLLAEAGYPDGNGFPEIELLYNTSEKHKAVCEAIQEMWKKNLNINVKLANQEWAVFQDSRHQGNFTIARGGYIADYADPVALLELLTKESGNNDAHWYNDEFDGLIKQSMSAQGKERDELLYKAQEVLMNDMPVAPLYYYTDPIMVKEYVKGWEKTSLGHWYLGNAYIEKAE